VSEVAIDTSRFNFAMRELERRGIAKMPVLIRAEAGVVLKVCLKRTKIPDLAKVDATSRLLASKKPNRMPGLSPRVEAGEGYVVAGIRAPWRAGRVWLRSATTKSGAKFILAYNNGGAPSGIRIGAPTMARLTAARDMFAQNVDAEIRKGHKTIGLAKQSWLQVANSLGIDLSLVKGGGNLSGRDMSLAQNASGRVRRHQNGVGTQRGDGFKFVVTIKNTLPYGRSARLDRILAGVLAGRVKLFEQLVRKGYIDDAEAVAKSYPNIGLTVSKT
jgi:hypothetical protein